jgi:transcription elongation factor Elf1
MIIFGTKAKTTTIGTGQFYCPKCGEERQYTHKKAKKYFSLYFIPIIPMGDMGEYVECQTCGITYKPEVLHMTRPKLHAGVAEQLNVIKAQLQKGQPVEYMVRDLTAGGLDRDVANGLVKSVAGNERKQCSQCELSYVADVTECSECGAAL